LIVDAAKPHKLVIGLTGGIASGKSVVGRELAARGGIVIDADHIAREVVEPGTSGLAEIVRVFGRDVLKEDGNLDREKLAARVFHDADARKTLNGILHPRIGQRSAELIAAAMHSDAPYIIYEAPLLVETGAHRGMAALIVVAASPAVQLARMQARDGMSEDAARARLAAQLPLEQKLAVADYVIHNDNDRAELSRQIADVHARICLKLPEAT
jgi:dephospho-CoA kinase